MSSPTDVNRTAAKFTDHLTSSQSTPECFVDVSWIDADSIAGIGWILYDSAHKPILKGSAAIEPTVQH